jgi:hypothetical protein
MNKFQSTRSGTGAKLTGLEIAHYEEGKCKDLMCKVLEGMLENLDEDITDFSKFKHVDLISTYECGTLRSRDEYVDYRLPAAEKYTAAIVNNEMTVDEALTQYYIATGWRKLPADEEGNLILI